MEIKKQIERDTQFRIFSNTNKEKIVWDGSGFILLDTKVKYGRHIQRKLLKYLIEKVAIVSFSILCILIYNVRIYYHTYSTFFKINWYHFL